VSATGLEVTPREARDLMAANPASVLLIDCRTDKERATAAIPGSVHIPMAQIPARLADIESGEHTHVIVHCHHGVRSLQVVGVLRQAGIHHARSMAGGIERWSLEVDPAVPRY